MEHVDINAIEPPAVRPGRRDLSDALGTTDVAVVHFDLEPGQAFSGALHAHAAQEEAFVVLEGTATFELEDGQRTVGAGEAVRFAPGEFQRGYNAGEEPVRAVVIGAPRVTPEESPITALVDCASCDDRTPHESALSDGGFVRICRNCGTTNEPRAPPGPDDE